MARISELTIQEIHERLDAVYIISEYVRLEKRGNRYWGLCPFHTEKTPSFTVDGERKFYYCFGCHKGGGVVNFIMEMEKLSYPDALEFLARKLGVPVQYDGQEQKGEKDSSLRERQDLLELYQRVAGSFHHILLHTEQGALCRDYLARRGISQEMIERFRLGYAPRGKTWLYHFLRKKGYSEAFLAKTGLFSRQYPEVSLYHHRLMFPIADRRGTVVAFGGRILEGEGPKYINSPETMLYKKREILFALDVALPAIRSTKEVYLCEGYMDVIALHQAGIENAVAPLGTAFTEEQAHLLHHWADRVLLLFDRDAAGQQATEKAILTCRRAGLGCAVAGYPREKEEEGAVLKDPAEILQNKGIEALQKYVKYTINDFDYLLERARALYDTSRTEGKSHAVTFFFPFLETLSSEVSRESCVNEIADAFGVEKTAILKDFYHRTTQEERQGARNVQRSSRSSTIHLNDEVYLFLTVIAQRKWYPFVRAHLSPDMVEDSRAKELFVSLEECYRLGREDMDSLLEQIQDPLLRDFVLEKTAEGAFSVQPEKIVQDGIRRIRIRHLERQRTTVVTKLKLAQSQLEYSRQDSLEDMLAEIMHIDAEIKRLKDEMA
ncbi:DNA primase [Treponema sp. J25]|uniref:DNA primase n=1 Tax=Treponema sp. J25 TaxID=2094121 RepID=UPI001051233B|nr:DNA primase [Treponema sp. J25]TCW60188.1 DNA primase [Treponema sp. J25]